MISDYAVITRENADQLRVVAAFEGHTAPILSLDITPNGQRLASGSMDGTTRLWDLSTQQPLSVLTGDPEKEQIARVAFSPLNPHHLVTAVGRKPHWAMSDVNLYVNDLMRDLLVPFTGKPAWRLWDTETGTLLHTEEVAYAWEGTGLTYSRDGRWLAANGQMFDTATEPYTSRARVTQYRVGDLAFSDDNQRLAIVTFYEKRPEAIMSFFVEVYAVGSWRKIAEVKETRRMSGFSDVRFIPHSQQLLVRTSQEPMRGRDSHKLYHFKGDSYDAISHVMDDVACFAAHPNASLLAIAYYDGRIALLDWDRQKTVATVQAYQPAKRVKMPWGIVIETRGKSIMNDVIKSQYRASRDMVFSPDGKLLIAADGDRVIRVWGIPA